MKTSFFLCLMLIGSTSAFTQQKQTRTLIISGGGARASWGAGFAKGLVESGNEYQIVGGTSGGAIITPLVIMNRFDALEELFSTITNNNIYNVNPIRSNGDIKVLKSAWRTLFGHTSIGENKNTRKLLQQIFSKDDYSNVLQQKKDIFCVLTNLNTFKYAVQSIQDNSYEDLLDWIWASASPPILTAPVEKNGQLWIDGGLTNNVPIDNAYKKNSDIIDVIVLAPKDIQPRKKPTNIPQVFGRTLNILINAVIRYDIFVGELMEDLNPGTILNVYYMSNEDSQFLSNLYSFEASILSEGYKRGYKAFKNQSMSKKTFIMRSDKKFYEQK